MSEQTFFYSSDANLKYLDGKTLAIIGYGNQGRAQALNLRDSGQTVIIGQRESSKARQQAQDDGFTVYSISQAIEKAQIHLILLPDEVQATVYQEHIENFLASGDTLVFATGFAIHYEHIQAAKDIDVILVAPKGPGLLLRSSYEQDSGIFNLAGVHQDASGHAFKTALAISKALGCTRIATIKASFKDEAETDLFGEQVVLCGGVTELVKSAVQVLTAAGYPEELAYIECFHELKQCVDLMWERGLPGMWAAISDTAEYGALTRGPRIITENSRNEMRKILTEIQNGQFAEQWQKEALMGKNSLKELEQSDQNSALEAIGKTMRKLIKND